MTSPPPPECAHIPSGHVLSGIEALDRLLGDDTRHDPGPGLRLGTMAHIKSAVCPTVFARIASAYARTSPRTVILTENHHSIVALSRLGMIPPDGEATGPEPFVGLAFTRERREADAVIWTSNLWALRGPFVPFRNVSDDPALVVVCDMPFHENPAIRDFATFVNSRLFTTVVVSYYRFDQQGMPPHLHAADVVLDQKEPGRVHVVKHRRAPSGQSVDIDPSIFHVSA